MKVSQAKHHLTVVEREIGKLIQPIKDGVSATSIKKEIWRASLFFIGPASE